jgi:hypothetical protein
MKRDKEKPREREGIGDERMEIDRNGKKKERETNEIEK